MLHTSKQNLGSERRSGIVLLVVMAMLALFSTVALSFVFYAEAEATVSRYAAQAQTQAQAEIDPELLLSYFLSQLIYDTTNPYSAMRGHSLARNMYGLNPNDVNVVPFNGLGRMRFPVTIPGATGPKNNALLVNYQYPVGPNMRNPETDAGGNYVGGNVHWTYPDLNNMFLGAVNGNGEVLIPSFHRPWLAASATDASAKFMTLRPHASYHPQFNPPDWDGGGDVKNLEWGPGLRNGNGGYFNNDSIWMDLGFPVQTAPNGKRYKPLFAPLIVDLDNKINLFVHGNIMAQTPNPLIPHFSNMGYGWWEVNLSKVLNEGITPGGAQVPTEWQRLFTNGPIARYGANGAPDAAVPGPLNQKFLPQVPPYWSKSDFGADKGRPMMYPGAQQTTSTYGYPNNKLQTYPDYGAGWDNGLPPATTAHAAGYNPFALGATDDKIGLVMSHIEALYRFMGTGSPAMTSDLLANMPKNFLTGPQAARTRWLSTLRSMDLDRPGLMPYNWKNMVSPQTTYPLSDYQYVYFPQYPLFNHIANSVIPAPALMTPAQITPTGAAPVYPPIPPLLPAPPSLFATGEFNLNGLRSNLYSHAALNAGGTGTPAFQPQLRVLLNRNLTPYPPVNPGTGLMDPTKVQQAIQDRTNLALDVYNMLIKVTGVGDPRTIGYFQSIPSNAEPNYLNRQKNKNAARWLAQLALNIVDFIDEDDYMTPWQWCPQAKDIDNPFSIPEWLFGTELNQLVINEVYAQIDNDVKDPTIYDNKGVLLKNPKAANYCVNFWVELHNPFKAPVAGSSFPRDGGKAIIQTANQNNYQIVVTTASNFNSISGNFYSTLPVKPNGTVLPGKNPPLAIIFDTPKLPDAQVWPTPGYPGVPQQLPGPTFTYVDVPGGAPGSAWGSPYTSPAQTPYGFLVIGPDPPKNAAGQNFLPGRNPFPTPAVSQYNVPNAKPVYGNFPQLSWVRPVTNAADPRQDVYGIYLQRLANPNLPYNPNPGTALFNPYITVDYFDKIGKAYTTLHDSVVYDQNGNNQNPAAPSTWSSWGRKQPYVGFSNPVVPDPTVNPKAVPTVIGNWVPQKPIPANTGPQHTFNRHNGRQGGVGFLSQPPNPLDTLTTPFYWPVHLDRQLVNPLELLNVSCYAPWQFTQKFGAVNQLGVIDDHRAPWDNQNTLLYRFLEMAQTPYYVSPVAGVPGGRVTGKININTIWDKEILDALVDNPNILVDSTSPLIFRNLFQSLMDSRSPRVDTIGVPGPTDDNDFNSDIQTLPNGQPAAPLMNRPFKSLNVGVYPPVPGSQYPNGLGIENTILRTDQNYKITPKRKLFGSTDNVTAYPPIPVSVPPIPQLPAVPPNKSLPPDTGVPTGSLPFKTNELLTKIYNNTTTRSNVFAVWLTVGFFEVVDEGSYPVKLGGEIGRGENRHIRHRMFSIIDRTNLMMPNPETTTAAPIAGAGVAKVTLKQTTWNLAVPGQVNLKPFSLQPGMSLLIDYNNPPVNQSLEVVTITAVDTKLNQITASFTIPHAAGAKVSAVVSSQSPVSQWSAGTFPKRVFTPPSFQIATPGLPGNTPGTFQSILGNPGPQEGFFDPRQNTLVVPYFSIIQ